MTDSAEARAIALWKQLRSEWWEREDNKDDGAIALIAATLRAQATQAGQELAGLRHQNAELRASYRDAVDKMHAMAARLAEVEGALYSVGNCLAFWLEWAKSRGATTLAGDDLLNSVRALTPAPPKVTS